MGKKKSDLWKRLLMASLCIGILIVEFQMAVCAMEFGGFDISMGTGETEENTAGWDEELSDENSENASLGEAASSGDEQNKDEISKENPPQDIVSENEEITDKRNEVTGNKEKNPKSSGVEEIFSADREVHIETENRAENIKISENITPTVDLTATPSTSMTVTPSPILTEELTPAVSPEETRSPEFTIEEGYGLLPMECQQRMKVLCQKLNVMWGKEVKIFFDKELVTEVLSVRGSGQEMQWEKKGASLEVIIPEGSEKSEKESCILEIAFMVKADLAWTRNKKNVILSYDLF